MKDNLIPEQFNSAEEAGEFWDTHSAADYWDEMDEIQTKTIDNIKAVINQHKPFLRERYRVDSLSLFGSYVRGEQTSDSDLDILVEFYETIDLFDYIRLENFLSELLDCRVDLVMRKTLKPLIKTDILNQAVAV